MKRKLLINIAALVLALGVMMSVGLLTAFAEPEDGGDTGVVADEGQAQVVEDEGGQDIGEEPAVKPDYGQETDGDSQTVEEVPATEAEYEPIYEYIYGYGEGATTTYEEPESLSELPTVSSEEVVEATAVVIPDVAVSDASVFSGIVMWLCVALGIAVLVGVLVSKRTRRRGV